MTAHSGVELGSLLAHTWGRHMGIVTLRVSSTVNDTAPVQNLFRLGGFLRLSGLDTHELSGQHAGLAYSVPVPGAGAGRGRAYGGLSVPRACVPGVIRFPDGGETGVTKTSSTTAVAKDLGKDPREGA
jgi:hypothetical protein